MKKGNIPRFKLDPKKPPKADWRAFDAMSEEEHHRAALDNPYCPPATEAQLAHARREPNVRTLRQAADDHRYMNHRRRPGDKSNASADMRLFACFRASRPLLGASIMKG
jgi:hypothetical protein